MGGGRATPVRVARERNGISPTILFTCNVPRRHVVGVNLDLATGVPRKTLVVPLKETSSIPELLDRGVHAIFEYAALANQPDVRTLQHGDVSVASDATTYVFANADFHTNLFRIPLRR